MASALFCRLSRAYGGSACSKPGTAGQSRRLSRPRVASHPLDGRYSNAAAFFCKKPGTSLRPGPEILHESVRLPRLMQRNTSGAIG